MTLLYGISKIEKKRKLFLKYVKELSTIEFGYKSIIERWFIINDFKCEEEYENIGNLNKKLNEIEIEIEPDFFTDSQKFKEYATKKADEEIDYIRDRVNRKETNE